MDKKCQECGGDMIKISKVKITNLASNLSNIPQNTGQEWVCQECGKKEDA
jgi:uncharacterized protein with PIN domain